MIPERFLDELRDRVSLVALIGRHVRLAKRGQTHTGLCPFHNEKSPSFHVHPDHFHCFGCGAHGDAIEFLQRQAGLDFRGAVEDLAAQAGLAIPELDRRPDHAVLPDAAARSHDARAALSLAAAFYAEQLRSVTWVGEILAARAIAPQTIARFGLGWAPADRRAMCEALAARGVSERAMLEAGLLIPADEHGPSFDRFRARIMIPIRDHKGEVVGFGGRAVSKDTQAKYLNSPEGPLFDKSRLLFNLDRAREAVQGHGRRLIVVEGYMDVLALTQHGLPHAVAPMGTALTPQQLGLLWRLSPQPTLCFDGDKAGFEAALRAVETALPLIRPGRSLDFVLLPDGLDPDDMMRKPGQGPEAFRTLLDKPMSLADMLWAKGWRIAAHDGPEARGAAEAELRGLLALIQDDGFARHFTDHIERRLEDARAALSLPKARRVAEPEAADAGLAHLGAACHAALVEKAERLDWLGGWLGEKNAVSLSLLAAAEAAGLGVARVAAREADFLWEIIAEAEDRQGEQALILPVRDDAGCVIDLLALDIKRDMHWARHSGVATLYGQPALTRARRLGAPLRLYASPAALLRAWAAAGAEGSPEAWGCVLLGVGLDIEALLLGVGALIVEDEEAGARLHAQLTEARKRRRALERDLPAIWLPVAEAAEPGPDDEDGGERKEQVAA